MTKNTAVIYGLTLTDGKYYVGKTLDLDRRFQEHKEGIGSIWTKLYPPISPPIVLQHDPDIFDENLFFKKYVLRYGIANVRGDIYCKVILSLENIQHLEKELDSANNQCYHCHQPGHFISTCPLNLNAEDSIQSSSNKNSSKGKITLPCDVGEVQYKDQNILQ